MHGLLLVLVFPLTLNATNNKSYLFKIKSLSMCYILGLQHSWSALSGFTSTSLQTRNKKFNTARGVAECSVKFRVSCL